MEDFSKDPRVVAVRADKQIGVGSCSTVDECLTDEELVDLCDSNGWATPERALRGLKGIEDLRDELEDDVRAAGNVSPLHSPREPGHVYDDDPNEKAELQQSRINWEFER